MTPILRQSIHQKIRVFSLVLFVSSLPFSFILINNIALFLLALNWLIESNIVNKLERMKRNRLLFLFIQLYAVYLFGLSYSQNMHQGIFELEKKLTLLFLPLILSTSNTIPARDLRLVFKTFVASCTIAAVICYGYAIALNYKEGHTLTYVYNAIFNDIHLEGRYYYFNYWYFTYELFAKPLSMHPIYFAMYLVFSSCVSVWLWADFSNWKRSLLLISLLSFNFVTVVLLSSRAQLAIFVLLATIFILFQSYQRKKIITGITIMLFVYGLGVSIILLNPIARERFIDSNKPGRHYSDNKYGEGGLSLRKYKWLYTMEAIKNHPIIGSGTGDSQDELQEIYEANHFKIGYDLHYNSHNQFLQTTLEVGIIGLISLLVCFVGGFFLAFKTKNYLYVFFIILFFLSCFSESMLEVNKGIVFFSFFNAIFAFHFLNSKHVSTSQTSV